MLFKGQELGKYKILASLGSGGFGTVYLARDTWIDKEVAIKVPHKQHQSFGELLREPRLLASLSHPNIVSITTAEKQDEIFFIVMEYVKGETLEGVLARDGVLDLRRALDYAVQICNGVDHAHRQGVLHRDLRPANVLVSKNGVLKVADFGTSRFLEIAAHGTTVIGSPAYMAPEQFQGKAVFASDLYSLGVTMYQMLVGELPYDPPTPASWHKLLDGSLLRSPRVKNAAMPKALCEIVLRALAPDVTERYQRASDLLEDLLSTRPLVLGQTPTRLEEVAPPRPAARDQANLERAGVQRRLQGRAETPASRTCWHCSKPLHARAGRCPFCGEAQ
ncbi:MAG: serine/threonine-protein kinase [Vicinamibacteraceae bacterium]